MQSFDKTFDFPYLDLMQIVYSDKNYAVGSLVIETYNCGSRISQTGAPTLEGMLKPIILQTFCRKLHENDRIWNARGSVPGPHWIRDWL